MLLSHKIILKNLPKMRCIVECSYSTERMWIAFFQEHVERHRPSEPKPDPSVLQGRLLDHLRETGIPLNSFHPEQCQNAETERGPWLRCNCTVRAMLLFLAYKCGPVSAGGCNHKVLPIHTLFFKKLKCIINCLFSLIRYISLWFMF